MLDLSMRSARNYDGKQPLMDKSYVRTRNGMLFNVNGYRHPIDHVYGSLKYVNGVKWTNGYVAALAFLKRHHPAYVDRYIRIPRSEIDRVYSPAVRWQQLLSVPSDELPTRLAEAIRLGKRLAEVLNLEIDQFGITDSLLWGEGHRRSDIDLVVFGDRNAQRVLERGSQIYRDPGFQRPDPTVMTAPYGLDVPDWAQWLARKMHMGSYQGRLFSLRAVKADIEFATQPRELPINFHSDPDPTSPRSFVTFTVCDASHSLYFPAIYRNQDGDELVDYSVVYEGTLCQGDTIECPCYVQRIRYAVPDCAIPVREVTRYIVDGSCQIV